MRIFCQSKFLQDTLMDVHEKRAMPQPFQTIYLIYLYAKHENLVAPRR